MNMFERFKYGPQVIVKLTKDGLQAIFKLNQTALCANRTLLHTNKSKAILRDRDSRAGQLKKKSLAALFTQNVKR